MRPTRQGAIAEVLARLGAEDLALFTTGMISREAFASRDREGNFYMIGSMGLCAPVALGVALARPDRRVVCFDGDGSALMSMGVFAMVAAEAPRGFVHVVLDNEAYESTGGQPTYSASVDVAAVALACGYRRAETVSDADRLDAVLGEQLASHGPTLLRVVIRTGARKDLGRPSLAPLGVWARFREYASR